MRTTADQEVYGDVRENISLTSLKPPISALFALPPTIACNLACYGEENYRIGLLE